MTGKCYRVVREDTGPSNRQYETLLLRQICRPSGQQSDALLLIGHRKYTMGSCASIRKRKPRKAKIQNKTPRMCLEARFDRVWKANEGQKGSGGRTSNLQNPGPRQRGCDTGRSRSQNRGCCYAQRVVIGLGTEKRG